jgi:predicted NAD/FAD-dependent oxidoreductase
MRVRADLIDPLCIAALNTPSSHADATVFLRVLHDALFGERGGSDLLLPADGLSRLFPTPAMQWLAERGAPTHLGHRVQSIVAGAPSGWLVDGDRYDAVILACSAVEAARLTAPVNAAWATQAAALRYEPIATVYLQRHQRPLQRPMVALRTSPEAPAQFAFDLELLGQRARTVAWVVSGAREWLDRGVNDLAATVQRQALDALPASFDRPPLVLHTALERRATFACVPNLARPPAGVAPGLMAAGDYIEGPYPATLEGAVRSGLHAAMAPVS